MAINYEKVKWNETPYKYANPENMNKMDNGIKSACDGIDSLNALDLDTRLNRNGYGDVSGGRNLWDEKWESGAYSSSGEKTSNSEWIRNCNKIKVNPSTLYYAVCGSATNMNVFYFESTGGFISYTDCKNKAFTTPSNCGYIGIQARTLSAVYNHDIAIIEGTSGTYEPYYESNKMLTEDANEIASLKYLGWTVPREMPIKNVGKSNGMTQMVGRVDMGTLSWERLNQYADFYYFRALVSDKKVGLTNLYCNAYTNHSVGYTTLSNKEIIGRINEPNGYIYIRDDSYSDATQFRNSLSGTYLYYELASPVEWSEGSEQIVENTTDIASLMTQVNELIKGYDGAGYHNGVYRGKSLGSSVTSAQYSEISSGRFRDLYIGDYWTIGGVNYRIAGFDYYYRCGDSDLTTHHAVIVPDTCLYNHVMNDTTVTTGGYVGSKMYTEGLESAKSTIKTAFSGHVLKQRVYLTNATSNGKASAGAWCDSEVDLMCEEMVYGCGIFRPTSDGSNVPTNFRVEKSQLPLFQFRADLISNRVTYWLRDVVTATAFALVYGSGFASYVNASNSFGVRPSFCIKG